MPSGPARGGALAALGLVGLAPITAEFLFGYLDVTGEVWASLAAWVFFLPLYGGLTLLIRELSVRLGAGWPTRLLWGTAFGLAMTALIDLSLFTRERSDISFWGELMEPTRIEALGISAFPLVSWVLGHVVLSTAVPIVLVETLAGPRLATRPWVARPWLVVAAALFVVVALSVRRDEQALWGADPSATQLLVAAAGCLALVLLGVLAARSARPVAAAWRPWPAWAVLLLTGAAFGTSSSFPTWWGTALTVVLIVVVLTLLARWSRHPGWTIRHLAAAAYGPVLVTVLLAFLTPPAEGATRAGVLAQAGVLTALTVLLGLALLRRTRAT